MKVWFVAFATTGVLLSGCATSQPDDGDTASNQPDLPFVPDEKQFDTGSHGSESKGQEEHGAPLRAPGLGSTLSEILGVEEAIVPATIAPKGEKAEPASDSSKPKTPSDTGSNASSGKHETNIPKGSDEETAAPLAEKISVVASPAEEIPTPRDPDGSELAQLPSHDPLLVETTAVPLGPVIEAGSSAEDSSPSSPPKEHLPSSVSPIATPPIKPKDDQTTRISTKVASTNPSVLGALGVPVEGGGSNPPADAVPSGNTVPPPVSLEVEPVSGIGANVSATVREDISTETAEVASPVNVPSNVSSANTPAVEEKEHPSRSSFSSRLETTESPEDDAGLHRRIGSRDSPLDKFLGRENSRSRMGFSDDSPSGKGSAQGGEDTSVGFSDRPALSNWLRAKPIRRVGFSGKQEIAGSETEQLDKRIVFSEDDEWEYRATVSWLRRRDGEKGEFTREGDRSYEVVKDWLRRNTPEGMDPQEFTARDYARTEAWLRTQAREQAEDENLTISPRKYAALAKWLSRKPSSLSLEEAPVSGTRSRRDYSKVMQWIRGNNEP